MQRSLRRITNLFTLGLGATALVRGVGSLVKAAKEAEASEARLTATIRAQGHAAGFTREQLEAMNSQLMQTTGFDDEALRNGQATLLKFGNIYGDVFSRAMKASADLAAFQGTDLASAFDAVGKALQNPAEGIKQLQAQIGKLDPAQRKMLENLVEQNKVVEAQTVLLDIVQKKIGGTATLMNSGYTKAISGAKNAWDEFLEKLGESEGPFLSVTSSVDALTKALGFLADAVGPAAPSIAQEKVVKSLESKLSMARARQGRTDDSGRALSQAEWDAYIRSLEEEIKWARRDLDQLRQKELKLLFGDSDRRAKAHPDANIDTGGDGKNKNKRGAPGPFWLGDAPTQSNRNLLGLDVGFFHEQFRQAAGMSGEERANLLGLTPEYFATREIEQQYSAIELQQLRDLDAVLSVTGKQADDYLRGVQRETDMMVANAEQRRHMLDGIYLESIGLKEGSAAFMVYMEKLTLARDLQERLNGSFVFGAQTALKNYLDQVRNVSSASEQLFTNAFRGMEDALVEFVKTGKLSFRSLAESIVEDLIRMQIQASITGPLAGVLGNVLGGLFGTGGGGAAPDINAIFPPAKARGGPVSAGMPYIVGEAGPELFVPRSGGQIVPNGKVAGDTYYIDARGADREGLARLERLIAALNASIEPRAIGAVSNEIYRGRRLSRL